MNCYFFTTIICAQPQWVDKIKIESSGIHSASAKDKKGNTFTAALESSGAVINPGLADKPLNSTNLFISKANSGDSLIWEKVLTGITNYVYCEPTVALDSVGNVYITYNRLSASDDWNSFIVKLDSLGNTLWTKSLGKADDGGVNIRSVTIDKKNEACITGFFWGNVTVETTKGSSIITANQKPGVFACKMNAAGNYIWVHGMEQTNPLFVPVEPQQVSLLQDDINTTANNIH